MTSEFFRYRTEARVPSGSIATTGVMLDRAQLLPGRGRRMTRRRFFLTTFWHHRIRPMLCLRQRRGHLTENK